MATSTFAAPLGVPIYRAYDANGDPLASGQLETYVAGTSTPLATYPTYTDALAGTNANANPVILDSAGAAQVWVQATAYKFILKASVASGGATLYTQDNVSVARGSPFPAQTEWVDETNAFVYGSVTTFNVTGVDVTATYHAGRRLKTVNTGGTRYGTVVSSSFASDTNVVLINDSGTLDSGLSTVSYGWNSYNNPSYLDKRTALSVTKNGDLATSFVAATKVTTWTIALDPLSEWSAANNRWVCKYPGNYLVSFTLYIKDTAASAGYFLYMYKNGAQVARLAQENSATGALGTASSFSRVFSMAATDYIEMFVLCTVNTTVLANDTAISIVRIA